MVTQFVFSVILIIGTIVITTQLKYIKDKDLGFNRDEVFSFSLNDGIHSHFDAVSNELLQQPGILGVASSNNNIIGKMEQPVILIGMGKKMAICF